MKKKLLAITAATLVACIPLTSPGQLAVLDASNLIQTTITALKQVAAYAQQVEQYQTQIRQFENEILNTTGIAQGEQIWQQAQQTINAVMGATKVFQTGGQLENTLAQFQNINYWLANNPYQYQTQASINQTTANASLINGIMAQQNQIQADAANLQALQAAAGNTEGRKQALDAAAQLSALQANQLIQIRALLVQEQQALAARATTTANDDAQRQAATQIFYGRVMGPLNHTGW